MNETSEAIQSQPAEEGSSSRWGRLTSRLQRSLPKRGNGGRPRVLRYAHIIGWGKYLPQKVLTNAEIARMVETSDEWIVTRTGIRERRIAGEHESTATLALNAARRALETADLNPVELDLVIVASATPEHIFPATACLVQDALGAVSAGAFDLSAACSGWIYGVDLAAQAIATGAIDYALVIGAETLSRFVNWSDRRTCILFGDGAGAVILGPSERPGGVLSSVLGSDGSGANTLAVPAGGSRLPASPETVKEGLHTIQMDGRKVFRFATRVMRRAAAEAVQKAGLVMDDIALLIPHQANIRIIDSAARGLKLPDERVFVNLDRYGNTSSASIPIALCEALEAGRIQPDDRLVMVGFGAGLTWGAAVIQWMATPAPERPWRSRLRAGFYLLARIRSALRRLWRRLETWLFRPPAPGA
jgi:3-oxoacyl-[acyl-carrier-protein] synthase-3